MTPNPTRRLLVIALLSLCYAISLTPAIARTQEQDAGFTGKYWSDQPVVLPASTVETVQPRFTEQANSPQITGFLPTWTALVFQSGQDGNWEIYSAKSDGTGRTRLTNHPAADTQPRLNRGATRVAFVSNRDNNPEIYSINVDGAGLTRLTTNGAIDTMPSWSPNGQQIAFVSNRDGNAEVYVMNADGSNPLRLTTDANDDINPTWSPDGNTIAWLRAGSDQGQIWIANRDGSNAHAIAYPMYYLDSLLWSPDGTKFAFKFDSRIASMNIDGSELRELTAVGNVQPTSWSPDSQRVVYSEYFYRTIIIDKQPVQILERVESFHVAAGDSNEASVRYLQLFPLDAVLDWQTIDAEPPIVSIAPLPLTSDVSGVYVSWSCQERGNSGCIGMDIQVKTESEPTWRNWHTNTLRNGDYYFAKAGDKAYFRAKGRDLAKNEGEWDSENGRSTQFYAWTVSGSIKDNRNTPIVNPTVTQQPGAATSLNVDDYGRFFNILPSQSSYTITVTAGDFLPVTETFDAITNLDFQFNLEPVDNLIVNGGFESNNPNGWQTAGLTYTSALQSFKGKYSLTLGSGCTPFCNIDYEQFPPIAAFGSYLIDSSDIFHFAAIGNDGSVLYFNRQSGAQWSSPQVLGVPTSDYFKIYPTLTFDKNQRLQMYWTNEAQTNGAMRYFFAEQLASGKWKTTELPFGTKNVAMTHSPGRGVHIVYVGQTRYIPLSGQWEYGLHYMHPQADNFQSQIVASGPDVFDEIYDTWDSPLITVEENGTIHIAWWHHLMSTLGKDFYHVFAEPGRSFSSVHKAYHQGYEHFPDFQKLFVDELDRLHLQWTEYTFTYELIRKHDGTWYSNTAALTKASNGKDSHATFEQSRQTTTDYASASQVVTIPVTMQMPTLSFYYLLVGETFGNSNFGVSITYPVTQANLISETLSENPQTTIAETITLTSTQIFSAAHSTDWSHVWVDLQPWAGQTITITFGVNRSPDEADVTVWLDEVALGSWTTTVANQLDKTHFDYGVGGNILLTGENLDKTSRIFVGNLEIKSFTIIDSKTLKLDLPSMLAAGIYPIYLTNHEGITTALPSAISVGKQTWLPIISR